MVETDRIKAALRSLVVRVLTELGFDFTQLVPARVVKDNGNQTVDVTSDLDSVDGQQGVPVRQGSPGQTMVVQPGARCRMAFDGRDGAQPFVALWDAGVDPVSWTQRATDTIIMDADDIELGEAAGVVARDGDAIEIWIPNPLPPPNEIVIATGYLRVISAIPSKVKA